MMVPWTWLYTNDLNNGSAELTVPLMHVFSYMGKMCRSITPARYVSDFWSIPKLVRWLFDKYGNGNRYAVEHDFLCESELISRKHADNLLRQNCIVDGRFKRWEYQLIYTAVRCGYYMLEKNTAREVCHARMLAGLWQGDYTSVDPKTVPRPLWPDGYCRQ